MAETTIPTGQSETISCPLDDCGWELDAVPPSPLDADAPVAVLANHDQFVDYELRRHFATHEPRDILRTIQRLGVEHGKFAAALAELAVELRDNQASGETIVDTVLRIRTERDKAVQQRDALARRCAVRFESEQRLTESRFAWAREADRLEAELDRAVDQGNGIAAGLLGLFINGERGQPGYEAVRSRWMARTELQQRCDDLAAWRQGWSRSATSKENGEDLQCAADDANRLESGEVQ